MPRWTCPDCGRSFGRKNQSHGCAPSSTVDDYFDGRPAVLRTAYNAIARHLATLEGVQVDPVSACVMFKRSRTFAEVRAKRDCLVLSFILSRVLDDERITKTLQLSANRTVHSVDIQRAGDVDRAVRDWLTESYAASPL